METSDKLRAEFDEFFVKTIYVNSPQNVFNWLLEKLTEERTVANKQLEEKDKKIKFWVDSWNKLEVDSKQEIARLKEALRKTFKAGYNCGYERSPYEQPPFEYPDEEEYMKEIEQLLK
jgi:hypothetical protein